MNKTSEFYRSRSDLEIGIRSTELNEILSKGTRRTHPLMMTRARCLSAGETQAINLAIPCKDVLNADYFALDTNGKHVDRDKRIKRKYHLAPDFASLREDVGQPDDELEPGHYYVSRNALNNFAPIPF